ncbi:hypothetical protein RSOLAG22IIIB_11019 [Rhizoctonia solani]|uniref:Protein kinase domain-containing protein n=1 Tax=Rhizoctonia solani TaxID=456999 RepID=A0A0K6G6D2_9AGAM|nr:hypothetical protein RSOLAG22IIIB_11019 [Rhizoctonia solani]
MQNGFSIRNPMHGNVSHGDRIQFCIDLAGTVEHLHDKGIVNEGIKDAIVSDTGDIQLVDFGSAALVEYATRLFTRTSSQLAFNVRFTAPEILDETSKNYTTESDVYALGMSILHILTGKLPYAEDSNMRVLANVFRGVLPPRPAFDDTLWGQHTKDKLWGLLMRCWEHNPNLRPRATEVKQALIDIEQELNT